MSTGLGISHIPRSRAFIPLPGGQKSRVPLVAMLLRVTDILLLDELTNHLLDISREFERTLRDFPGTIITASHDRYFIERFGWAIWEVQEGRVLLHYESSKSVLSAMIGQESPVST